MWVRATTATEPSSYLREGDIHDNPDGSISFRPTRTRADLVTLQLGVSVGLRADH